MGQGAGISYVRSHRTVLRSFDGAVRAKYHSHGFRLVNDEKPLGDLTACAVTKMVVG